GFIVTVYGMPHDCSGWFRRAGRSRMGADPITDHPRYDSPSDGAQVIHSMTQVLADCVAMNETVPEPARRTHCLAAVGRIAVDKIRRVGVDRLGPRVVQERLDHCGLGNVEAPSGCKPIDVLLPTVNGLLGYG